jgi:hypothetical protein
MIKKNNTLKRILLFNGIALVSLVLFYKLHISLFNDSSWKLNFSLLSVYLFFSIASLVIISVIEILFDVTPANAGYIFLVGIFIKMGLFILIFYSKGLADAKMNVIEKLSIFAPLFLFLLIETLAITTRLKQDD